LCQVAKLLFFLTVFAVMKLLKYYHGLIALKYGWKDLSVCRFWSSRHENMHMIRHQLHFQNLEIEHFDTFVQKFIEVWGGEYQTNCSARLYLRINEGLANKAI